MDVLKYLIATEAYDKIKVDQKVISDWMGFVEKIIQRNFNPSSGMSKPKIISKKVYSDKEEIMIGIDVSYGVKYPDDHDPNYSNFAIALYDKVADYVEAIKADLDRSYSTPSDAYDINHDVSLDDDAGYYRIYITVSFNFFRNLGHDPNGWISSGQVWDVIPLKKVGPVTFGMNRAAVQKALGDTPKVIKKSKFSKNPIDVFVTCHVYYDDKGKCEAVEINGGKGVRVNGKMVFPGTLANVKTVIPDLQEDNSGYISQRYSIGVYVGDNQVRSILFGKPGYYKMDSATESVGVTTPKHHNPVIQNCKSVERIMKAGKSACGIINGKPVICSQYFKPEYAPYADEAMKQMDFAIQKYAESIVAIYNSSKGTDGPWAWKNDVFHLRTVKDVEAKMKLNYVIFDDIDDSDPNIMEIQLEFDDGGLWGDHWIVGYLRYNIKTKKLTPRSTTEKGYWVYSVEG